MNMLRTHQLQVDIDKKTILKNISLHASKGEFIGLIGPNGSGKSTLLRSLTGFNPIAKGELFIDELPSQLYKARQMARIIGYVPQDTSVDFAFSAQQIVLMGRHPFIPRFGLESKTDYSIAEQAMLMTDTLHLADQMVTDLSGGQRQMIFIAKALAQQPKLLLLDEPISALDIRYQLRVLELIRQLTNDGLTAIAALHDLNLAARYCDRIILLTHGEMISHGPPSVVLTEKTIRATYGVQAKIQTDPWTLSPAVTAINHSV